MELTIDHKYSGAHQGKEQQNSHPYPFAIARASHHGQVTSRKRPFEFNLLVHLLEFPSGKSLIPVPGVEVLDHLPRLLGAVSQQKIPRALRYEKDGDDAEDGGQAAQSDGSPPGVHVFVVVEADTDPRRANIADVDEDGTDVGQYPSVFRRDNLCDP